MARTIRGNRLFNALLATTVASVPVAAQATELIRTPQGVLARTLFSWEGTSGLSATVNGQTEAAADDGQRADFLFPAESLCQGAAVGAATSAGVVATQDLGHLCAEDDQEDVTVALISDTQEFHAEHEKTARLLGQLLDANPKVRLVINAGDVVQESTLAQWQAYRRIATANYSGRVPVVPVVGNHDYRNDANLGFFRFVYGSDDTASHYYTIDLGVAALIVLNSNVDLMSADQRAAQDSWLTAQLAALRAQGKRILVTYHHPAHSSGVAHLIMPTPPKYADEHWVPLFKAYRVSLVLNGHEHVYERLLVNGVPHLVAGPAGGKIGRVNIVRSRYSQFMLAKMRTVSLVTARKTGPVSIRTYDTATGKLVDAADYASP